MIEERKQPSLGDYLHTCKRWNDQWVQEKSAVCLLDPGTLLIFHIQCSTFDTCGPNMNKITQCITLQHSECPCSPCIDVLLSSALNCLEYHIWLVQNKRQGLLNENKKRSGCFFVCLFYIKMSQGTTGKPSLSELALSVWQLQVTEAILKVSTSWVQLL